MSNDIVYDINKIIEMIPHRYPILLVDRVLEIEKGEKIIALKNVTFNEPHFAGHFPAKPIMPGVLIVEALAQASAILVVDALGAETDGKLVYFMSIENAKFRQLVTPGDSLKLVVKKERNRGNVWKFKGEAILNDKVAAEAEFTAMIVDR